MYRLRNRTTGHWLPQTFPTIVAARRYAATLNGWYDVVEAED